MHECIHDITQREYVSSGVPFHGEVDSGTSHGAAHRAVIVPTAAQRGLRVRWAGLQYGGPPPSSGFAGGGADGFAAHAGGPQGGGGMDEEAARKIFENLFGTGFSSGGGGGPGYVPLL